MKRGYTLLETVVYVSILAVIVVLVLSAILNVYRAYTKTLIERNIATNGDIAMERLIRELRAATSATGASVFGSHPGILKLSTNKTFSLSGSVLQISDGIASENLTSGDVSITNLVFYQSTSPNSTLVKIELTVAAGSGIYLKNRKFYGSAVMRGAY